MLTTRATQSQLDVWTFTPSGDAAHGSRVLGHGPNPLVPGDLRLPLRGASLRLVCARHLRAGTCPSLDTARILSPHPLVKFGLQFRMPKCGHFLVYFSRETFFPFKIIRKR